MPASLFPAVPKFGFHFTLPNASLKVPVRLFFIL
jgi:hypothetical protein